MTDKERKSICEQNQNQKIIDAQCKDKIKTEDSVPHEQNAVAQDRDAQKKLTFRIVDSPMGIGKSLSLMTQVRFNVAYGDDDLEARARERDDTVPERPASEQENVVITGETE